MNLRFKSINVQGIKGLSEAEFPLSGSIVAIKGSNGIGKTTLLALMQMFAERKKNLKIPQPIMTGLNQGSAVAEFEDEMGRTFSMTYTATAKEGGKVSHSMRYEIDGKKIGSNAVELTYGDAPVVFDINKFVRQQGTKAGKEANIRDFFQGVLGVSFEDIDKKIQEKKDELAGYKLVIGGKMPVIEDLGLSPKQIIEMASEPPQLDEEIQVRYKSALDHNQKLPVLRGKMNESQQHLAQAEDRLSVMKSEQKILEAKKQRLLDKIAGLQKEIQDCQSEVQAIGNGQDDLAKTIANDSEIIPHLEAALKAAVVAVDSFEPVDVEAIQKEIQEATAMQERHQQVLKLVGVANEILKAQEKTVSGETEIKSLIDQKAKVVSDSIKKIELPRFMFWKVEDDGQIKLMYRDEMTGPSGVDFVEGQVRASAMKMAAATMGAIQSENSDLKVIFMEDASLLDTNSFNQIATYLNNKGFQLVAEIVTDESLEIVCEE